MTAPTNEIEPDHEQELGIAVDNAQDPMLEIETGPKQDEQEQFIAVDHAQDHDILPQHLITLPLPAQDIYNDAAPSPDAQPPPRPQRTQLPPTQLMYATPGQPGYHHVNYIQNIPGYTEPFQRTVAPQMVPFLPGYGPPYHQLFMTPGVQFCHPQLLHFTTILELACYNCLNLLSF